MITAQTLQTKIKSDPQWYIEKCLGIKLWDKQKQIVDSVFANAKTSVKSCHASGKSFVASTIAHTFLVAYPHSIVLTTAPTWRQVSDVLWKEIRTAYQNSIVDIGGIMLNERFNFGPDWFALGVSTDEPDKFQGYHASHILIIIDESSGIKPEIFHAIEGIGSTGHVRMLELGNPTDPTGHFANTFKNEFYSKMTISCFDTPNFKQFPDIKTLEASTFEQRLDIPYQYLITPQWVYERLSEWGEDSPMFQSRCLGDFPLEGEDTLVPLRYALAAANRAEPIGDQNKEVLGVDIARFGTDKTVLVYRQGNNVRYIQRFGKNDLMTTVGRIAEFNRLHPYAKINIDDSGVGGGVTDRLREMKVDVNPINVGAAPYNKEMYYNLRAELYWELAKLFEQGNITIPNDDKLIGELTGLKFKYLNAKLIIEKKEDMKKRGLSSPDSADALMLAFAAAKFSGWHDFLKEENASTGY